MGSLPGVIQRPLVAACAVAVASVSTEFSDRLPSHSNKSLATSSTSSSSSESLSCSLQESNNWVPKLTNLSFVTRIRVPVPSVNFPVPGPGTTSTAFVPDLVSSAVGSSPLLHGLFQSARSVKAPKPCQLTGNDSVPSSAPEVMYRWHLPEIDAVDVSGKSRTVVVLLGWLGSKQKHLKRYAEWYTSRGFHAITFTFPMSEIISYQVGGKAEEHVNLLVDHLADWLEEEHGKSLVFHTFSNTGWLTYGAMLERFQKQDMGMIGKIKGCIVDSAPVAEPDPQVWASGFSAAFLKKHSVATKGSGEKVWTRNEEVVEPKPALTETALLLVLEKFFGVVLNLPTVNRRLCDVLSLLSTQQPSCPQLYIYSSADRVIPAGSVESFIEKQRKSGREVRACNFVSTPHVDHYRNDPKLYTSQLTQFLDDCVLTSSKKEIPLVQTVE